MRNDARNGKQWQKLSHQGDRCDIFTIYFPFVCFFIHLIHVIMLCMHFFDMYVCYGSLVVR